jgi:hypothetical protein
MIGYWVPDGPVRTDHPAVLATVYWKPGKAFVAIASWAREKLTCHLAIDFAKLGLDAADARLHALEVPGFQPPATFQPTDAIAIEPGRGWMLMIENAIHQVDDADGSLTMRNARTRPEGSLDTRTGLQPHSHDHRASSIPTRTGAAVDQLQRSDPNIGSLPTCDSDPRPTKLGRW